MSTIKINDNYSNGLEGFNVLKIDGSHAVLYTSTGVEFLDARKGKTIIIDKVALEGFLGDELKKQGFVLING